MHARLVQQLAGDMGFCLCGITRPQAVTPEVRHAFKTYLAHGRHAGMSWLERHQSKRFNPRLLVPGVRTIIVLALAYACPVDPVPQTSGRVSCYALAADYHDQAIAMAVRLAETVSARLGSGTRYRVFVDTAPVLERQLAARAGVGFIGKNTCLIHPHRGSFFFLAEIFLNRRLPGSTATPFGGCGGCALCLSACPTGALEAPYTLNARRCISYLTIENRGTIPLELRPMVGNRVFGCDTCQLVCPFNRGRLSPVSGCQPRLSHSIPLQELLAVTPAEFTRRFAGLPVMRARWQGFMRNVLCAAGNSGDANLLAPVGRYQGHALALIKEMAHWACAEIKKRGRRDSNSRPPA